MTMFEKTLSKAMDKPEDWSFTEFKAIHNPSGVSLWLANGFIFFGVDEPIEIRMKFFWKIFLWFKLGKVRKKLVAAALERSFHV